MKPYQNHGKLLFQFILFLGDSILDIKWVQRFPILLSPWPQPSFGTGMDGMFYGLFHRISLYTHIYIYIIIVHKYIKYNDNIIYIYIYTYLVNLNPDFS